jgi:hypothetical protein
VKNIVVLAMLLLHGSTTYAGQGFYLMVPPFDLNLVKDEAPLREWRQMGTYDTALGCAEGQLYLLNLTEQKEGKNSVTYRRVQAALCIASDDPRLSK